MAEINKTTWTVSQWSKEIDLRLGTNENSEPFINVDADDPREFDAIFLGGGATGRFGAAYLRAMGGRALIIDRWPFLGGSCPHHACVPHHVFSDVSAQLLLERTFSGQLWFQDLRNRTVSIKAIVEMFRVGRIGPHAFMNYQSKEQLALEFVLNAPATILDAGTITAAGRVFRTKNIVLSMGSRPKPLEVEGGHLQGVFDHRSLVDTLDYEPGNSAVVIGGGKTAIEYACFFNATGRRTIIVSHDAPLAMVPDEETRSYLMERMLEQGMEFWEGSEVI